MKKIACVIASLAFAATATEPQYVIHDRIKGNVLIMTNTEEFVVGNVSNAVSYLEEKIDSVNTNSSAEVMKAVSEVAVSSTNYTDKVGGDAISAAGLYADSQDLAVLENVEAVRTNLIEKIEKGDEKERRVARGYADEVLEAASNYTDSAIQKLNLSTEEIVIPESASGKGVTFVDQYGEDQNVAIEIGRNSKAKVSDEALEGAASNTVARSVSIAIGAEADATVSSSSTRNQAIAIGFHSQAKASNAIAIGSGAQHPTETAETGNATVASGSTSIAMGYDAKATEESSIGIGRSAKAGAKNAVQLGTGTNNDANSLKFLSYKILDSMGQIPAERLEAAAAVLEDEMTRRMERVVRPGNMEIKCGVVEEQTVEPMLNGISEFQFVCSNGFWVAGGEAGVEPPMNSRNYNLLVKEIPQAIAYTNGIPYLLPPEDNLCFQVDDILMGRDLMIRCDPAVGVMQGDTGFALTNAPAIIKVREPSTNSLIIVAKPWNIEDL